MHLIRALALNLAQHIRVKQFAGRREDAVLPALYERMEDEMTANYPLARLEVTEDIAAHRASADASWVTGAVFTLDGGSLLAGGTA